jgi:hypothetical protein
MVVRVLWRETEGARTARPNRVNVFASSRIVLNLVRIGTQRWWAEGTEAEASETIDLHALIAPTLFSGLR